MVNQRVNFVHIYNFEEKNPKVGYVFFDKDGGFDVLKCNQNRSECYRRYILFLRVNLESKDNRGDHESFFYI